MNQDRIEEALYALKIKREIVRESRDQALIAGDIDLYLELDDELNGIHGRMHQLSTCYA